MNLRKVFIWGAGSCGSKIYDNIKDKLSIEGFIDSNAQKWNYKLHDLNISSPKIIDEFTSKPFIIISSTWANEIEEELKTRGFKIVRDYIAYNNLEEFWGVCGFIYQSEKNEVEESKPSNIHEKSPLNGVILSIGENNPDFFMKLRNLFLSIDKFGGEISTFDRRVIFMGEPEAIYQRELERLKVEITIKSSINPKYPHNNKIRLLEQDFGYDWYIMLDHDMIVTRDFSDILREKTIKAKPVDVAIISKEYWGKIYNFFGLEIPNKEYVSTSTGEPTLPFFNSGMIIVPEKYRELLYRTWLYYIYELIANKEHIEGYTFYIDEIALALALKKASLPISPLPVEMNFPTHIPVNELFKPESLEPYIIHYHWLIDESGFIKPSSYPHVLKGITAFNEQLKRSRRENFNNELFWDFRYSKYSDYGSGIGSRGETLAYKKKFLEKIICAEKPNSILDIGCGDQFVTNLIPDEKYIGVDISKVVIEQNSKKYPNRSFIHGDFLKIKLSSFEMTICLDLLIHIDNYNDYRNFIKRIIETTQKVGIVSGFESSPQTYCSELIFYYEPLSRTLRDFGVEDLQIIGTYRDLTVWRFIKKQKNGVIDSSKYNCQSKGHNDISNDTLNILRSQSLDSLLLDQLIKISRDNFGFFAKHTARAYEYVWLTKQVSNIKGKNILDVGTGLSPLPIYFAMLGANVYTIDNSKMIRNWQQHNEDWNEWGYIDYGEKYSKIRSLNIDICNVFFKNDFFDYIYSISVIEHFPMEYRRSIWERFGKWLKREGMLYLTIDLYKDSHDLWNYCYGELVEEREKHGDLKGILKEASPSFSFCKVEVEQNIYQLEKIDIATLIAKANK